MAVGARRLLLIPVLVDDVVGWHLAGEWHQGLRFGDAFPVVDEQVLEVVGDGDSN